MQDTCQRGEIGEAAFLFECAKRGYWAVQMPHDCPYDVIVDRRHQGMMRVQCKFRSVQENGSVCVNLKRPSSKRDGTNNCYTSDVVDFISIYVPEIQKVALVPIADFDGLMNIHLRVTPPKNGQVKGVIFLDKYLNW